MLSSDSAFDRANGIFPSLSPKYPTLGIISPGGLRQFESFLLSFVFETGGTLSMVARVTGSSCGLIKSCLSEASSWEDCSSALSLVWEFSLSEGQSSSNSTVRFLGSSIVVICDPESNDLVIMVFVSLKFSYPLLESTKRGLSQTVMKIVNRNIFVMLKELAVKLCRECEHSIEKQRNL